MMTILGSLLFAGITVSTATFPTYPYSDPDPVPRTDSPVYPYFRFDGSSATSVARDWRTVILDNGVVRVTALPEIGGRVWGAEDLATKRPFIYFNHAVKFRNVASRGPWCSGGIEFNFGVIGHSPFTSAPVDWCVRTNADSSVSYFVSTCEYVCRTFGQVEVRLRPGERFFTTETTWYNASGLVSPYYQWMNAAFPLDGNPEFLFPGTDFVGHEGDAHPWPADRTGRDLSVYRNNAFGHNKSYHVLNGDSRFFGIWWPERNLGAYHLSPDGDKYGRKIWLWALSREGGIWEDLLTDSDGQYAELQSGRGFNQPRKDNVFTPFKHPAFGPGRTDVFTERWGVLERKGVPEEIAADPVCAARPVVSPGGIDWTDAKGLFLRGRQALLTREDRRGERLIDECLARDPAFAPALVEKANLLIRRGRYAEARDFASRALAVDAYDPAANYLDGFAAFAAGDIPAARERLPLAAFSLEYRAAAETLLARAFLRLGRWADADRAACRALEANAGSPEAALVRIVAARRRGESARAARLAEDLLVRLPLFHSARFELNLIRGEEWTGLVRNEFPAQTYMEMGSWYEESGLADEAQALFALAGDHPIARVRLGDFAAADRLPVSFAMPFRREERAPLERAVRELPSSWRLKFHLATLLAFFGEDASADRLLDDCGEKPDDPVSHLFLASRRTGAARLKALDRARDCGDSVRVGIARAAHFEAEGNPERTLEACEEYLLRYPGNDRLEIAKARVLFGLKRYAECLSFLEHVSILPSEFGDNAGDIWRKAARALGDERRAEECPERLGLGKPYPEETDDVDGRPVESVWAGRTEDRLPPLVDFEDEDVKWTCEADGAEAEVRRTDEKRMFGDWSLAVRSRGLREGGVVRVRPSRPFPVTNAFDHLSVWVRGERCAHGAARDPDTTQCPLWIVLNLRDGRSTNVAMRTIAWSNWFWNDKNVGAEYVDDLQGAAFDGFVVSNMTTRGWRTLHFDNVAFYRENYEPRPYPDVMTNLSFSIREDTILPDGAPDARLRYRYAAGGKGPELFASWDGSEEFAVFDGGGVIGLDSGDLRNPTPVLRAEELSRIEEGGATKAVWRYAGTNVSAVVRYVFRPKGKSLIVDAESDDATVVRYSSGIVSGGRKVVPFSVPYLTVGWWKSWTRPRMVTAAKPGGGEVRLFESSVFDWYASGASAIEDALRWEKGEQYARHYPRTDGRYNSLRERLFITVSPEFSEVLPTIPNPKSPWKHVTGKRLWRAHALHDIAADKRLWKAVHDAGMTQVAICDHEPMWYSNGESFTFRTNTIPSKGGDAAVAEYSRYLREDLGFVYGVYDNVTDYAPVNAAFDRENVSRWAEGDLIGAWVRCYSPKPCLAPTFSDVYPPVLKEKFGFNGVYCDVITTCCPWWRTDYDHRVPGAGRYAPVFYAFCEALLRHKRAFDGPVWSEGRQHMMYAGFADGSYAQCGNLRDDPMLVDFDLMKIHPLCCNFGMGCLSMFQPPRTPLEASYYIPHAPTARDRDEMLDRFIGMTLAYGHAGYLVLDYLFDPPKTFGLAFGGGGRFTGSEEGWRLAKRSYFMVQAIAARYTQSDVKTIRYPDDSGTLHPTSEALFLSLPARHQVAVEYGDGTFVVVNGHSRKRLRTSFGGREIDLCPLGYVAWTVDGEVYVESNDTGSGRFDVAHCPAYRFEDRRTEDPK